MRKRFNQDLQANRKKDIQAFIEAQVAGNEAKSTMMNDSTVLQQDIRMQQKR